MKQKNNLLRKGNKAKTKKWNKAFNIKYGKRNIRTDKWFQHNKLKK